MYEQFVLRSVPNCLVYSIYLRRWQRFMEIDMTILYDFGVIVCVCVRVCVRAMSFMIFTILLYFYRFGIGDESWYQTIFTSGWIITTSIYIRFISILSSWCLECLFLCN